MKTLWLLRHAKASPGADGQADRDRPLNARGREAAGRIGRYLAARGVRPDLVLCSPSLRTRETIELVAGQLGSVPAIEFEEQLYLASERTLLEQIGRASDDLASLLLVGHNPGLEQLALELAARGNAGALDRMREKFPTGALAGFSAPAPRWRQFARGCELVTFVTPKSIRS
jgi:phosphohistidine phosphatase